MDRIQHLMQALPSGLDAALITSDINRRYYTGFPSSAGVLLATRENAWLIIDSRYFTAAQETVAGGVEVILQDKLFEQLVGLCRDSGIKTLAVESDSMSLRSFDTYCERLQGVELVDSDELADAINRQRSIKTPEEIARIREAQRISDETFSYIIQRMRPGRTEREIALDMEFYSRKLGSQGVPFSFIVVSGVNSAVPHGVPSDKPLERGDLVTMDFGSTVDGYCSDMTRTVAVGTVGEKQRLVYETVLEAQLAALQVIRAGVVCNYVDRQARDITEREFPGAFGHGLGHALGLVVHEEPRFSPGCDTVLEPGMVLSVEPGIYLPGEFGVRIEDIVAVTEDGCDNLVRSPKALMTV